MNTRNQHPTSPGLYRNLSAVLLCVLVFAVVFAGCATVGRDFPVTDVSQIEIGKTTREEVRSMFGSPWRVGIEDGQPTWTYGNYRYSLFQAKSAKDLVIRFNDRGVVASYTFSTTEHSE